VSLGNVESGLNEFRNCIQLHPTFLLLWYTIVNSPFSHCLSVIHLYYPTKLSAWTCFFALIAAVLAQSVERVTAQREVAGPIPGAGAIFRVLKYVRNEGTVFPRIIAVGDYSREVIISNIAHWNSCPKYFVFLCL